MARSACASSGVWQLDCPDQAIVQRLHSEVTRIIALPAVREQWAVLVAEPISTTPEQFAAFIKDDIVKWQKVIRDSDRLHI